MLTLSLKKSFQHAPVSLRLAMSWRLECSLGIGNFKHLKYVMWKKQGHYNFVTQLLAQGFMEGGGGSNS